MQWPIAIWGWRTTARATGRRRPRRSSGTSRSSRAPRTPRRSRRRSPISSAKGISIVRLWLRLVRGGAFITVVLTLAACAPGGLPAGQSAKAADATSPTVRIVTPANGQRVQGQELTVEVEYADDNSGIAAQSFHALLNGRDYAGAFDQHSRGASGNIRVA